MLLWDCAVSIPQLYLGFPLPSILLCKMLYSSISISGIHWKVFLFSFFQRIYFYILFLFGFLLKSYFCGLVCFQVLCLSPSFFVLLSPSPQRPPAPLPTHTHTLLGHLFYFKYLVFFTRGLPSPPSRSSGTGFEAGPSPPLRFLATRNTRH